MTKTELLKALENVADDAEIVIDVLRSRIDRGGDGAPFVWIDDAWLLENGKAFYLVPAYDLHIDFACDDDTTEEDREFYLSTAEPEGCA